MPIQKWELDVIRRDTEEALNYSMHRQINPGENTDIWIQIERLNKNLKRVVDALVEGIE